MNRLDEWRALDHCDDFDNDTTVKDEAEQVQKTKQVSDEWIIIKDSERVEVRTVDTQAALSLQASIKVAIGVVLSLAIADGDRRNSVMQELQQVMKTKQKNSQKTIVEKSRNVVINTYDTDIAVNIQLLLQILIAIVLTLDIL
ncbi:spore coat protein X [Compostibacillus humi]|uniref:Spore coat protein X n=1 Tax=Compostibacillus humi TaxID=1245525 RepID=A0A8J2ZQR1_9BACI|nr:spore coat protein [Compostibacillus humi]GGH71424.1 spore coat protein X [Compostibacillus humi]